MKTIEPLLYNTRPMDPAPINMSLAEVATALREGQTVMVKLEPGDGTHYGLLITPAWAKHVSTHLGRFGITFMRSTDYLIITKLSNRDGETCYAARGDCGEYEMTGIQHPWTRQILAWWLNVLWAHIRE